jgi:predicted anti-sigma-YlaC factor YlaD
MFDNLTALGYSLVTFSVVIGVGIIILYNFGNAVGGTANTTIQTQAGYLGTSGLAGWTPAIIAFSVGMLFLGAFFIKKGRSY